MGIDVHKMLGYGLTNVKRDDPRINWDSTLLDYNLDTDGYLNWVQAHTQHSVEVSVITKDHEPKERKKFAPYDAVVYRREYGLENVLCVRPLWLTNWYRAYDMIDWVEETWGRPKNRQQLDRVKVLEHGLYPYTLYMDATTGEPFRGDKVDQVMIWQRLRDSFGRKPKEGSVAVLDEMAQKLGYADHAEALRRVVPLVPEEIQHLTTWGHLFTSDDVWRQLRPMIYVWWC